MIVTTVANCCDMSKQNCPSSTDRQGCIGYLLLGDLQV